MLSACLPFLLPFCYPLTLFTAKTDNFDPNQCNHDDPRCKNPLFHDPRGSIQQCASVGCVASSCFSVIEGALSCCLPLILHALFPFPSLSPSIFYIPQTSKSTCVSTVRRCASPVS